MKKIQFVLKVFFQLFPVFLLLSYFVRGYFPWVEAILYSLIMGIYFYYKEEKRAR